MLLNNDRPMVPKSTLRAGYRLVLHGLAAKMLYELLVQTKRATGASPAYRSLLVRALPADRRGGSPNTDPPQPRQA